MTWSSPAYEAIGQLIRDRTGLVFLATRVVEAEAGVRRAMSATNAADLPSYLRRLEGDPAILDDLVAELTVAETYFFREPLQFDFIRSRVLGPLTRSPSQDRAIRVWSAGCATGEEAYSLAILLEEAGVADRARILATDISRKALARVSEASYGAWSFRGVDPRMIERYFRTVGKRRVLQKKVRERVHVEQMNLASDPYPSVANGTWHQDLILCRNVLLYIDPAVVPGIVRRFAQCLPPGGWLVTGPSDPPIREDELYETVIVPGGVFYQRRNGKIVDTAAPMSSTASSNASSTVSTTLSTAVSTSVPVELPSALTVDASALPSASAAPPESDLLADASAAFERGEYVRSVELAQRLPGARAAALSIRALANAKGPTDAARAAADAALRYPLVPEIHLLSAILFLDAQRYEDADRAVRKALYLDRTLAFGHFLLGLVLTRRLDPDGARRAFRNAQTLCAGRGPDETVAFSEGQGVRSFLGAVMTQLELLDQGAPS